MNVCGRLWRGFQFARIKPLTGMTVDAHQHVANLVGHDVAEPSHDRRLVFHRDALDAVVEDVGHPSTSLARSADRDAQDAVVQIFLAAFLLGHVGGNDDEADVDRQGVHPVARLRLPRRRRPDDVKAGGAVGGGRVGLGTGELRGDRFALSVTWMVTVSGAGLPRASPTDTTEAPANTVPTVHAAIQVLMAAPSVASAHRSLLEKAGTAGENWHRPESGRFGRRIAAIHPDTPDVPGFLLVWGTSDEAA